MASSAARHNIAAPSQPQLALALAIVKQKPPGKDIKDHILQIRQFIQRTKDESHFICPHKFFDSVSFWQRAYEESEAEHGKLQDRIYELEQRNESLLAKMRVGTMANGSKPELSANKRKGAGTGKNADSSDATRKKARTSGRATKGVSVDEDGEDAECTLSFLRQLYTLQKALQKKRNGGDLATAAVILCKAAERELISAVQQESSATRRSRAFRTQQTTEPDVTAVLNGTELAFQLVRQALRKLSITEQDKPSRGQVAYYLMCLFESTMTALTQHCTLVARRKGLNGSASSEQMPRLATRKTNSRPGAGQETPAASNPEDGVAPRLTNLLCSMALSLDLARPEDQEVMEGCLFVILNRVGKMLALFAFNTLQLRSDICPDLTLPEGLKAMHQENLSPNHAQIEAKHLIRLLERILGNGSPLLSSEALDVRGQFVAKTKSRLQKTLLQAVFGADDPLFQTGLTRLATPPPQDLDCPQENAPGSPEWFTQELWRLIGWDLLHTAFAES